MPFESGGVGGCCFVLDLDVLSLCVRVCMRLEMWLINYLPINYLIMFRIHE